MAAFAQPGARPQDKEGFENEDENLDDLVHYRVEDQIAIITEPAPETQRFQRRIIFALGEALNRLTLTTRPMSLSSMGMVAPFLRRRRP